MVQPRHEESFMPKGKPSSPQWIEEFFEYQRNHPEEDISKILFQAMNTDSLTQVLARSGINHLVDSIESSKTPTGVLFFDLMGFKKVNDTEGHEAGDQILTYTANKLANIFRTSAKGDRRHSQTNPLSENRSGSDRRNYSLDEDIVFRKLTERSEVGRFGGDEFMVFLPRVQTYKALENIGFRVTHAMNLDQKCQPSSIGGALYLGDNKSMTQTIKDSDSAMYAAKRDLKLDQMVRGLARSESGLGIYSSNGIIETFLSSDIKSNLIA